MSKKALPNISAPTLSCVLPISKIKIKYRPFVVREQKALLLAQQSGDMSVIYDTIKSVILSCSNNDVEFDKIPVADLSYFFLQMRIASVGPEIDFQLTCENCGEAIRSQLMLDQVTVDVSEMKNNVKITEEVGIIFRLPTFEDSFNFEESVYGGINMLYTLIDTIYDADQVYTKDDYTEEEFKDWLENLNDKQVALIDEFVQNIPELSHSLDFTCTKCGTKHSRTLVGLQSFFRFDDAA